MVDVSRRKFGNVNQNLIDFCTNYGIDFNIADDRVEFLLPVSICGLQTDVENSIDLLFAANYLSITNT